MQAELHCHKDFDNICPFFHIELVDYLKVNDQLAADLGAVYVGPIDILLDVEAEAAKIAGDRPARPIELEVGIDVGLATRATQWGAHLHNSDLVLRKWRYPKAYRQGSLSRLRVEH